MRTIKLWKFIAVIFIVILFIALPEAIHKNYIPKNQTPKNINMSIKKSLPLLKGPLHKQLEKEDDIPKKRNISLPQKASYEPSQTSDKKSTIKKVVYLTIDDGPSVETPVILDILEKENIKATFFVVGYNCIRYPNYLKLIVEKNHLVGNHSYSHKYQYIYKSYTNFVNDFKKAQSTIYKITGQKPKYYRFPGGSLNRVSVDIKKFLEKNNITYIDWNAITGDSFKNHDKLTYKDIFHETFSTIGSKKEIVLLMHDSPAKKNVVEALPFIIKELKEKGYIFETVDKMKNPLQFKNKKS